MPESPYIHVKNPGLVNSMTRADLIELHWKKDRYIDFVHEKIHELNNKLYSTRKYRYDLINQINNQEEMIGILKMKLFTLTGSITG